MAKNVKASWADYEDKENKAVAAHKAAIAKINANLVLLEKLEREYKDKISEMNVCIGT